MMEAVDDRSAELLRRFLETGDEVAIEALVADVRPQLACAARRVVGDGEADDVLQTAFHALLRRGAVPADAPVVAWLHTAVVRIAYRRRAARRREHEIARRLAREATSSPLPSTLIEAEERALLRREVDRLPDALRDAVVLYYLEGLSSAETARLLDVGEPALRQRLHRARALLRSRLPRALVVLPWLVRDAAALAAGGIMKLKVAVAVTIAIVAALSSAIAWRAARGTPPHERAPAFAGSMEGRGDLPEGPAAARATVPARFAAGVVEDESGAPVAGVAVIARGKESLDDAHEQDEWIRVGDVPRRTVATTDGEGRFALADSVEGMVSLVFVKAGYAAADERSLSREMRVVLRPGRAFRGVVRDTEGRPIPLAKVACFAPAEPRPHGVGQVGWTGADGRFEFRSLEPAHGMVLVVAWGYENGFSTSASPDDATFTLKRTGLILDVRDEVTGAELGESAAILLREPGPKLVAAAHRYRIPTEPDARRLVLPLWRETLTGEMEKPGADGDLWVIAAGHRTKRLPLRLAPGEEPPQLLVRLEPGDDELAVAGVVSGGSDAELELLAPPREGYADTLDDYLVGLLGSRTDVEGRFGFRGLPSLRYRVRARAPGMGPRSIDALAPATDLRIALAPAGDVEATLRGAGGAVVAGARVHLEIEGERRIWSEKTDAAGVARFRALPAGTARLAPNSIGGVVDWDRIAVNAEVLVPAGGTARVELRIPERRTLEVRARTDSGRALSGAIVAIRAASGHAVHADGESARLAAQDRATDDAGTFSVQVYPGRYEVRVTSDGAFRKAIVEVPEEVGASVEVVFAGGGATVSGRVTDRATDAPVPGRPVYASVPDDPGRGWVGVAATDGDGRYRLAGLPAGRIDLRFALQSTATGMLERESPYPTAIREVELVEGEARVVDLAVPRTSGDGALARTVRVLLALRDAPTRGPIANGSAHLEGLVDGFWLVAGTLRAGADGRGQGDVFPADAYRGWAYGEFRGATKHRPARIEPRLRDGALEIDAALERE